MRKQSNYHCTFINYQRTDDGIVPVRIRKEWVGNDYTVVRSDALCWADRGCPSREMLPCPEMGGWCSIAKLKPMTRTELVASGHIKEAGHGQPCFMLNP